MAKNPGSIKVTLLDQSTTEEDLNSCFSQFGQVTSVNIRPGEPRKHAFVNFTKEASADAAVKGMHCQPLKGVHVHVKLQQKKGSISGADAHSTVQPVPLQFSRRGPPPTQYTVKVTGIHPDTSEIDVVSLFATYGAIDSHKLIAVKGKPSYAYFNYKSWHSAATASSELHEKTRFNSVLRVSLQNSKQPPGNSSSISPPLPLQSLPGPVPLPSNPSWKEMSHAAPQAKPPLSTPSTPGTYCHSSGFPSSPGPRSPASSLLPAPQPAEPIALPDASFQLAHPAAHRNHSVVQQHSLPQTATNDTVKSIETKHINNFQLYFLEQKRREQLNELDGVEVDFRKHLEQSADGLHHEMILSGARQNVSLASEQVDELLQAFRVEEVVIKLHRGLEGILQRQLQKIKKEVEESLDATVFLGNANHVKRGLIGGGRCGLQHDTTGTTSLGDTLTCQVCGVLNDDVKQAVILLEEINMSVTEHELQMTENAVEDVKRALREKKLNPNEWNASIHCKTNSISLHAMSSNDLLTAREAVETFIKDQEFVSEPVTFNTAAIGYILCTKRWSQVTDLAKVNSAVIKQPDEGARDTGTEFLIIEGKRSAVNNLKEGLHHVVSTLEKDIAVTSLTVKGLKASALSEETVISQIFKLQKEIGVLCSWGKQKHRIAAETKICFMKAKPVFADFTLTSAATVAEPPIGHAASMQRPNLGQAYSSISSLSPSYSSNISGFLSPLSQTWMWLDDNTQWTAFSSSDSAKLTTAHSLGQTACQLVIQGRQYEIDLQQMRQTNSHTGHQRKVRCVSGAAVTSPSCRFVSPMAIVPVMNPSAVNKWYFRDDKNQWSAYDTVSSAKLNQARANNQNQCQLSHGKWTYTVDFNIMKQVNTSTRKSRDIKCETSQPSITSAVAASSSAANPVVIDVNISPITVMLEGLASNIQEAKVMLNTILTDSIVEEIVKVPGAITTALKDTVAEVGRKNGIELVIKEQAPSVAANFSFGRAPSRGGVFTIRGVRHRVDQCVREVQSVVIELSSTAEDVDLQPPDEWEPQTDDLELKQVAPYTAEWINVEQRMCATLPRATVHSIARIQNKWLWERYALARQRLKKKNGGADVNEKWLFHGTRQTEPKQIYQNEEGFDMRFSADGMWGRGNYFAVNSQYSHNYAHAKAAGQREMLLAKVMIGDSCEIRPNSSLRRPPIKMRGGHQVFGDVLYDTVTGETHGSRVYITYSNEKAYPFYLITYSA